MTKSMAPLNVHQQAASSLSCNIRQGNKSRRCCRMRSKLWFTWLISWRVFSHSLSTATCFSLSTAAALLGNRRSQGRCRNCSNKSAASRPRFVHGCISQQYRKHRSTWRSTLDGERFQAATSLPPHCRRWPRVVSL